MDFKRRPDSVDGIYRPRHYTPRNVQPPAKLPARTFASRRPGRPQPLTDVAAPVVRPLQSLSTPAAAPARRPEQKQQSILASSLSARQNQPSRPTPVRVPQQPQPLGVRQALTAPTKAPGKTRKKHAKWSVKRKVFTSILAIVLVFGGVGAWYGARILGSVNKVFHGNVLTDAQALWGTTTLKGESQGRVNILLTGNSADDPGHGGATLTDSIMVISIDTKNHTGTILSIPRDLWVDIPGWSHQKINAANDMTHFNQAGYPSGGIGQLEQIIQTDLGIPLDYYVLINYTAFKDAVNAVGGITLNIQSSDPRGLYDAYTHLKLPNGPVTLDGQQALDLARARGDGAMGDVSYGFAQGDFARTQHQRQELAALAQKAQTAGVIANPGKVTKLAQAFGNNVQTDLNLQDTLRLVQLTKGMNISTFQSVTYPNSGSNALLANYTAPDGEEALIPKAGVDNWDAIQQYYQQITSSNPIVREAPSAAVLNGNGGSGVANQEGNVLKTKGFTVPSVADASRLYPTTMIVDKTDGQKPASLKSLQQLFPGSTTVTSTSGSTEAAEASGYSTDFVVILGQDWKPPTATTATQSAAN